MPYFCSLWGSALKGQMFGEERPSGAAGESWVGVGVRGRAGHTVGPEAFSIQRLLLSGGGWQPPHFKAQWAPLSTAFHSAPSSRCSDAIPPSAEGGHSLQQLCPIAGGGGPWSSSRGTPGTGAWKLLSFAELTKYYVLTWAPFKGRAATHSWAAPSPLGAVFIWVPDTLLGVGNT